MLQFWLLGGARVSLITTCQRPREDPCFVCDRARARPCDNDQKKRRWVMRAAENQHLAHPSIAISIFLAAMPGVFPDYLAPIVRSVGAERFDHALYPQRSHYRWCRSRGCGIRGTSQTSNTARQAVPGFGHIGVQSSARNRRTSFVISARLQPPGN